MFGNIFGRLLGGKRRAQSPAIDTRAVAWIEPEKNPWGVPTLDIRPVTQNLTAFSGNPAMAMNAVSYQGEDGLCFVPEAEGLKGVIACDLRFKKDRYLADGVLFAPGCMEEKWTIFLHEGKILFVRSWTRSVVAAAEFDTQDEWIRVRRIKGQLIDHPEASLNARFADYLLRCYVLNEAYPAPFPCELKEQPGEAALWCFSAFGNKALYATPHALTHPIPDRPLRTHSLLHIAIARGDHGEIIKWLDRGVPADLLAADGLSTLHWALGQDDLSIFKLLLDRGAPVDARSEEGATALMTAVQAGFPSGAMEKTIFLLDHGADPNAVDHRGFTALHRVAEKGRMDFVKLLVERGARIDVEGQGYTPLRFATERGHTEVVEFLQNR